MQPGDHRAGWVAARVVGRRHGMIKVVKKRRGKKQIINEGNGRSWRASE